MRSVPDVDHRSLAVSAIDIASSIRRRSHEGTGIPPISNGLLEILRVLEGQPGITVHALAERLGRQISNVSTQLRELDALGLITRTRDDADKRYVILHPTKETHRIKALLENAWAGEIQKAVDKLSAEERSQLQASLPALGRLTALLDQG